MTQQHAFFSAMGKRSGAGTRFYTLMDGKEVEVTLITETREAEGYRWPDKKYLGVINGQLPSRGGQVGSCWLARDTEG